MALSDLGARRTAPARKGAQLFPKRAANTAHDLLASTNEMHSSLGSSGRHRRPARAAPPREGAEARAAPPLGPMSDAAFTPPREPARPPRPSDELKPPRLAIPPPRPPSDPACPPNCLKRSSRRLSRSIDAAPTPCTIPSPEGAPRYGAAAGECML
eukprot:scaffold4267_cov124-Isochrysis_galbana.AAC.6